MFDVGEIEIGINEKIYAEEKVKNKAIYQVKGFVLFLLIFISFNSLSLINCKKSVNEKKQIILISVDTLRGDHLSSYGYCRNTSPNLSKLIEDSIYFTNAYPNGCWTMPSHISLLTGTLPSRHVINEDWKSIQKKYIVD